MWFQYITAQCIYTVFRITSQCKSFYDIYPAIISFNGFGKLHDDLEFAEQAMPGCASEGRGVRVGEEGMMRAV